MDPYLLCLQDSLDQSFQHLEILGAFSVLGPQAVFSSERINTFNLTLFSRQFLQEPEAAVLQEWPSYKQHVLVGAFKGFDQLTAMTKLASQFDEWGQSTPALTSWHANAPTIPVSSVNCQNRLEE
ncbi:uncharacterized protein ACWYII_047135 isoform 1-T1 [Salvelinus alpinus]